MDNVKVINGQWHVKCGKTYTMRQLYFPHPLWSSAPTRFHLCSLHHNRPGHFGVSMLDILSVVKKYLFIIYPHSTNITHWIMGKIDHFVQRFIIMQRIQFILMNGFWFFLDFEYFHIKRMSKSIISALSNLFLI